MSAQRYSFRHYGQPEGLHNVAIQCLLQDRTGFLWVGTQNGLFRYDGRRFEGFGKSDGLPSARIESLYETADGTLWVGTRSGLARSEGHSFREVNLGIPAEILGPSGIASDQQGRLYVGTAKGLLIGQPSSSGTEMEFRFSPQPAGVKRGAVYGVHVDPLGTVWFGCGRRLCKMESGWVTILGSAQGVPAQRWDAIQSDGQANLWIRSSTRLLVRPKGSDGFVDCDEGLPQSGDFGALSLDRRGRLFVPTDLGVASRPGDHWRLLNAAQGLAIDATSSLLEDREGSIWIGLRGAGLARWLGYRQWEAWTRAEGLSSDTVWQIRRDAAGTLWVGTDNGLNKMTSDGRASSQKITKVWTESHGLGGNRVRALAIGSDGTIWVGSNPGGVSRLNPSSGAILHYDAASGLTDERVRSLLLDSENRLWVCTRSGLFRGTPPGAPLRFERLAPPLTDDNEMFFQSLLDRQGRVWVAASRGLARWENGAWTRFTADDGLKSNYTAYLAEAPDGALWVGYREAQGISRLTFPLGRLHAEHFSARNGLRSDQAIFVGVDARGQVWYGSDDGVDVREGETWRHYGRSDGLIWDDCDGSAFFADADGSVWIGTSRGLSHFRPLKQPLPEAPPPVVVTSIREGEKPRDPAQFWNIPYRDRSLLVRYSALTYRYENEVRFRYRLRGLEDEWVETDQTEVRYPGLPTGAYTFEVAAATPRGAWGRPARIPVRIQAPWWQAWWLRAPLLLGAVVLIRAYWRRRLRLYLEQQRQLELAVEQRTCELHVEKEKYRAIVDTTNEWIWETDHSGRISYSNPAAEAMLGYSPDELVGQERLVFVHDEDRQAIEQMLPGLIAEKCGWAGLALRWRHKSGHYLYLESNAVPVLDGEGTVTGYRGADRDITERKQAEEALRESEKRYELAVNGANDGLWDWNLRTGQIYFSPRWKSMLGYEAAGIGASPEEWFSRVHPHDLGRLKMEIAVHLEGKSRNFQHEHRMRHKDGGYRWMLSRGLAVLDADGKPLRVAGSQTDITLRKRAEYRLLHEAFHDGLTDLPNRNLFLERLERAAARAQRRANYLFAVLFLDLDRFKVINDSLGHVIGDQLLVGIARRLEVCLRAGDTVSRIGGDEFVILLDDLKAIHDATQVAERIQRDLNQPFLLSGHEVFTSASIGIAMSNTGYDRPEDLLRDADTVMYRAKERGKARYEVFHAGLHTRAVERMRLETDLRKALDRQEFLLYYQPIVARATGEISSLEALLRWKHPERGLVPPSQFIPVAEETGIIRPLGEWVLRTACAQNKAWQQAGFAPVRVAVNFSGQQFKQPDLPRMIGRTLKETGLEPQYLELELTESIVLHNAPSTIKTLEQLSAMGIRISIDDFGTGYSSLRYLHQFPISTLKIDRFFIRDIITNPDGAAIAKAIIDLGHSLKLNVIAEGVETEEQLAFLRQHQCDEMQGYVLGYPVPAEKIPKLLEGRLYLAPVPDGARKVPVTLAYDSAIQDR